MYEAEVPGHLLLNGKDVTPEKRARSSGFSVDETKEWLEELEEAGVFSRSPGGTIFSRKMVRDAQKSDEQRKRVEARWEKERKAKAEASGNSFGITETIPQKPEATPEPDTSEADASSFVETREDAPSNDDYPPNGHCQPKCMETSFRYVTLISGQQSSLSLTNTGRSRPAARLEMGLRT